MGSTFTCTKAGEATSEVYMSGINLHDLPECVISKILDFLDTLTLSKVAQTCKRLRSLAYNCILWRDQQVNITLNLHRLISHTAAQSFKERGIRKLCISDWVESERNKKRRKKQVDKCNQSIDNCAASRGAINMVLLSQCYRSSLNIQCIGKFKSLTCLVLIRAFKGWVTSTVPIRKETLVPLVNLERLTCITHVEGNMWRSIFMDDTPDWDLDYPLATLLDSLPKLRDISLGKTSCDNPGRRLCEIVCYDIPDSISLPKLERFSIVEGVLGSYISSIPQRFPDLKHLQLANLHEKEWYYTYDEDRVINVDVVQRLLDNFKRLQSLVIDSGDQVECMIQLPTTLKALNLKGQDANSFVNDLGSKPHVSPLMNLIVIELDIKSCEVIEHSLISIINSQSALEVLILSRETTCTYGSQFHAAVRNNATLYSLIGVNFPEYSDIPKTLAYISQSVGDEVPDILARRSYSPDDRWIRVKKYTQMWYQAHGTQHFYPEGSLHDLSSVNDFVQAEYASNQIRLAEIEGND